MEFGEAIILIREKKKLTQEEASIKLKITQSYLSQLERNKKRPSYDLMELMSKVYKIPVAFILFFVAEEKDVPGNKRFLFRKLAPLVKELIAETLMNDKKKKK